MELYLFFAAALLLPLAGQLALLRLGRRHPRLRFARWLLGYDGLLSFSQAHREGDSIRILRGPLKDMEGRIVRVDKRGRSGQVLLNFNGREIAVWLGFELVEEENPLREF